MPGGLAGLRPKGGHSGSGRHGFHPGVQLCGKTAANPAAETPPGPALFYRWGRILPYPAAGLRNGLRSAERLRSPGAGAQMGSLFANLGADYEHSGSKRRNHGD